jgi:hypothetical protein
LASGPPGEQPVSRAEHGERELLDEIVAEKPRMERGKVQQ